MYSAWTVLHLTDAIHGARGDQTSSIPFFERLAKHLNAVTHIPQGQHPDGRAEVKLPPLLLYCRKIKEICWRLHIRRDAANFHLSHSISKARTRPNAEPRLPIRQPEIPRNIFHDLKIDHLDNGRYLAMKQAVIR